MRQSLWQLSHIQLRNMGDCSETGSCSDSMQPWQLHTLAGIAAFCSFAQPSVCITCHATAARCMSPARLYSSDADLDGILSVLLRSQLSVRPQVFSVRVLAAEHTAAGSGQPQRHDSSMTLQPQLCSAMQLARQMLSAADASMRLSAQESRSQMLVAQPHQCSRAARKRDGAAISQQQGSLVPIGAILQHSTIASTTHQYQT